MYSEREMVLDALQLSKAGTVGYTHAATETSNQALRQTLLQIRNNCEQSQQQIGQLAQSKHFYVPAPQAAQQDVASISQFLKQSISQPTLV
jgi:spore coat protein CotF